MKEDKQSEVSTSRKKQHHHHQSPQTWTSMAKKDNRNNLKNHIRKLHNSKKIGAEKGATNQQYEQNNNGINKERQVNKQHIMQA